MKKALAAGFLAVLLCPPATSSPAAAQSPAQDVILTPVASTEGRGDFGFFSLQEFGGRLFAGTYCGGGGKGDCDVFISRPDSDEMKPIRRQLHTGESIYVLAEFKGRLYANTESYGFIFRSENGLKWEKVFSQHGLKGGEGIMGAGLAVFDGRLYASTTAVNPFVSKLFSSAAGDPETWTMEESFGTRRDIQIRELIVFGDRLHALGYDHRDGCAAVFTLKAGGSWTREFLGGEANHRAMLKDQRIIKALVWKGALWLTTSPFPGGKRVPPAGVWRWDGRNLANVYSDPARAIGTGIVDFKDELYFVDSYDWNVTKGHAGLHRSPTGEKGTWREVASLPEPESMDLAVHDGRLYVATRKRYGSGFVYRVDFPAAAVGPQTPAAAP